jgi:hypothetical protein
MDMNVTKVKVPASYLSEQPSKSCTSKGYELNITKALHKKLEATKRAPNMQCELTGGGIVLTADTATFELIRTAAVKSII